MARGKNICECLKGIRKQIAKANGIDYSPIHCTHKGDCAGTCPACEQEREYLERQLCARQKMGVPIKIIGLSMALASGSACSSDPSSPTNPSETDPDLNDTVLLTEELRPSSFDSSSEQNDDSCPEEMDWERVPYPVDIPFSVDNFRISPERTGRVARLPRSTNKGNSTQSTPKAKESTQPDDDDDEPTVGMMVMKMTSFPGGRDSLEAFLKENLHYPQSAIDDGVSGTVNVRFIVRPDGSISNAEVIRSVDPRLDEEALRIVRSMPNWEPGNQGKSTPFQLPIRFNLK